MFRRPQLTITDFQNHKLEDFEVSVNPEIMKKSRVPDELFDEIFDIKKEVE